MSEYYTVKGESTAELTEKKSRFIATVRHVSSEEEALAFITEMKKKYWDARHNCSAYIITEEKEGSTPEERKFTDIEKCSDDGEPSKTAGAPMLEVLRGAGLKNTAVVVTRYFGGILLGTGGLVRAYSQTAALGIEAAEKTLMRLLNKVSLTTDYNSYGKLTYIAGEENIILAETEFTENVTCICLCDDIQFGKLKSRMSDITAGKCKIVLLDKDYYPVEK